jgi:hypothetical protein
MNMVSCNMGERKKRKENICWEIHGNKPTQVRVRGLMNILMQLRENIM